jgi:hypothetical protein
MRAAIPASISVGLAALLGCGGAAIPTGTFRGERPIRVNAGTDPAVAAQLRRVELRIDEAGKATLEDSGIPWEGLVTRNGDRLAFEVLAVSGVGISKQPSDLARSLEFDLLPDGAIEYGGVRLTRTKP